MPAPNQQHNKAAYRSGLETKNASRLSSLGVRYEYEPFRIPYVVTKPKHYTPDILLLDNGIIVETKGMFVSADRSKHLMVKEQYPDLDIRFVFSSPKAKIGKKSKTTYAMWAESHGFQWAIQMIPDAWLHESANEASLAAVKKLLAPLKGTKCKTSASPSSPRAGRATGT